MKKAGPWILLVAFLLLILWGLTAIGRGPIYAARKRAADEAIESAAANCRGNPVVSGHFEIRAEDAINRLDGADAEIEWAKFNNDKILYGCPMQ